MRKILKILVLLTLLSPMAAAEEVRYLTTADFKQLVFDYTADSVWQYKGDVPCVIDFYTTWCGPCKRLAPIMEELAEEYCEQVIFYKVDTEKERELAYVFGIRSIPSILFVPKNGTPQMVQGLLPKETLEQVILQVLKKQNPRKAEQAAAQPSCGATCGQQSGSTSGKSTCGGSCGSKSGAQSGSTCSGSCGKKASSTATPSATPSAAPSAGKK